MTVLVLFWEILTFWGFYVAKKEKWHYQIDKDTHVLLGQPVEEVCWVAGQNLIIMKCRNGLDALLQLLQTRLHTLHLGTHRHDSTSHLSSDVVWGRRQNKFIILNPFMKLTYTCWSTISLCGIKHCHLNPYKQLCPTSSNPSRLVFLPVQHPGSVWPVRPGRRPSGTPSGWGFPASFLQ